MAYIQKLSNEILKDILDCIESNSRTAIPVDRRNHLSVESFRPPSPPPPSQAQDVANFRLSCRRFSELAIPYQYAKISLRFSNAGFQRLEKICDHHHLTRHTRKFSYLVPPFYAEDTLLVGNGDHEYHEYAAALLKKRLEEQKHILTHGTDVTVLRKAMKAFTVLQHVQLLRLIEPIGILRPLVDLEWPPACTHATKTMGEALLHGGSPFCRFSGPMMEPPTARIVQEKMLSRLASRLTCLELHFDGGPELVQTMNDLSSLARTVLQAAKNLQAIHIGFPSRYPLDLRLEAIFHNIRWDHLRAFGIQAWRLDASEIIRMVKRHRTTLRGLRLRDVQLKKGSEWREVLLALRTEMQMLDWVSLRRIDYSEHFDQLWANTMEVPDEAPAGASDSSDEAEADAEEDNNHDYYPEGDHHGGGDQESIVGSEDEAEAEAEDSDDDDEESSSIAGHTDHGPDADDIAISPDTPITLPFCTCDRSRVEDPADAEELGDNGVSVTYQQRKMWEKWVVGRCPEHA